MNSVEVQPFVSLQDEVEQTEHHSLLENGDNSWCHFRPTMTGSGRTCQECWASWREVRGTYGEQKLKEHILK